MTRKNNWKLDPFLEGRERIGIAGHIHPDGDCVGSTLAVYNYIKTWYPQIQVMLFLEPIPNIFKFLRYSEEIISDYPQVAPFDLFIAEDCSDLRRLGQAAGYFSSAAHTLCIDHHFSNEAFAEANFIDPQASSASELVFEMIDESRITKEIAECLYNGIIHDTGVFQYSCTSARTMEIGGILMEKGIDYPGIVDRTFYTKTFEQNKILGQALLNSRCYFDGQVIATVISQEEMQKYGALPKHLDGIVQQLRVTKDVKVALFLYENSDGTYKGSLRVNGDINLVDIARVFGGGGHVKATGFSIEGPADSALSRVLAEIRKQL